jgi:hypothetical protein
MTKKGRPPVNPKMKVLIQELVDRGWDTAEIIKKVQQQYQEGASDRNIQRAIARAKVSDDTPPWTPISEKSVEDAGLLLPVAQVAAVWSMGRRRVTQAQAKLLLWVMRLVPDLPAWIAFRLVLAYQRRSGQDTEDIDSFLLFAPWRGKEARARYWSWVRDCRAEWLTDMRAGPAGRTRAFVPAVDGVILACDLLALDGGLALPDECTVVLPEKTLAALCDENRDLIEEGKAENDTQR